MFWRDTDYLLSYVAILLATPHVMYHTGAMQKPEPTKVGGIRLTPSYWAKFRAVWQGGKGRDRFLRWVDREYKRIATKDPS